MTENEMVGWYHLLNGYELKQTLGEEQGKEEKNREEKRRTGKPGRLQSMGSQSRTQLSD